MNDYIPDPVKDFIPRYVPPVAKGGQKIFIANLSDDELRSLAREKLSEALQAIDAVAQPELTRKLCAEVKDRLDGKPAQAVTLDATVRQVIVNATISFADVPQHMVIEHEGK